MQNRLVKARRLVAGRAQVRRPVKANRLIQEDRGRAGKPRWVFTTVQESLEGDLERGRALRCRCPKCERSVSKHRASHDGKQAAHFQHRPGQSGCTNSSYAVRKRYRELLLKQGVPQELPIGFFHCSGSPVLTHELGSTTAKRMNLRGPLDGPLRVYAQMRISKRGNPFYAYFQERVPLPDGTATIIKIGDVEVPHSKPDGTNRLGLHRRTGVTYLRIKGIAYKVTVRLTKGKRPYGISVIAHKAGRQDSVSPATLSESTWNRTWDTSRKGRRATIGECLS
jgi:hypothetical protein